MYSLCLWLVILSIHDCFTPLNSDFVLVAARHAFAPKRHGHALHLPQIVRAAPLAVGRLRGGALPQPRKPILDPVTRRRYHEGGQEGIGARHGRHAISGLDVRSHEIHNGGLHVDPALVQAHVRLEELVHLARVACSGRHVSSRRCAYLDIYEIPPGAASFLCGMKRKRAPPRVWNIQGVAIKSKAALRREWKGRVARLLHKPTNPLIPAKEDGIESLPDEAAAWHVETAFKTNKRKYLFPSGCADLETALAATEVFVARADLDYEGVDARVWAKHRCVFFRDRNDAVAMNGISANSLGDEEASDDKRHVLQLLRNLVYDQIVEFREADKVGNHNCSLCGASFFRKEHPPHIDHGSGDKSFKSLVKAFLDAAGCRPKPGNWGKCVDEHMADPRNQRAWQDYHRGHAELRTICASCNLTLKE